MRLSLFLLPILSGVLAVIATVVPFGFLATPFILVPLVIYARKEVLRRRDVFIGGLFSGFISGGISTLWFFGAYPLTWAGFTSPLLAGITIALIWGISSLFLGIFTGIWAVVIRKKHDFFLSDIFFGAAVWILLSFFRSFSYSLLWWGNGTQIGPHWDFGQLGLSLADNIFLLHTASLGGAYLLEYIVAAGALAIFYIYKKDNFKTVIFSIGIFFVLFFCVPLTGYVTHPKDTGNTVTATAINIRKPSSFGSTADQKKEKWHAVSNALSSLITTKTKTNVLIFPEDTGFIRSLSLEERVYLFKNLARYDGFLASDSATERLTDGSLALITYYADATGVFVEKDQKRFLAPFGEYLPYWVVEISRLFGVSTWVDTFIVRRGYNPGTSVKTVFSKEHFSLTTLFCSEITPSLFYTQATQQGALLLANAASHSAFNGNSLLDMYTFRKAKIHAVTHGRPFIQAGNMTPSFIIDGNGQLIAHSLNKEESAVTGNINLKKGYTFSDKTNQWVLITSTIITLSGVIKQKKKFRDLKVMHTVIL